MRFCGSCGAQATPEAAYCPKCGNALRGPTAEAPSPPSGAPVEAEQATERSSPLGTAAVAGPEVVRAPAPPATEALSPPVPSPPSPRPPDGRRTGSRRRRDGLPVAAIAAVVVLVAAVGAGAALLIGSHKSTRTHHSNPTVANASAGGQVNASTPGGSPPAPPSPAASPEASTAAASTASTSAGSPAVPPPPASGPEASSAETSTTSPSSDAPLEPVERYWTAIGAHTFSAAYGYLVPGSNSLSESEFVSSEGRVGIQHVAFHGRVISTASSTATVGVVSLVTHDNEFGCRSWSGS